MIKFLKSLFKPKDNKDLNIQNSFIDKTEETPVKIDSILDDYFLDNKRIQKKHFCKIETFIDSDKLVNIKCKKIEVSELDFNILDLKNKLEKWNIQRRENNIDEIIISEFVNDIISNGFVFKPYEQKIREIEESLIFLEPNKSLLKNIIFESVLSIGYEHIVMEAYHPFNFKENFITEISPILKCIGINDIKIDYKHHTFNDSRDVKYNIFIGNDITNRKLEINSNCDFYRPLFYLLNQILKDYKSDYRFVDLEDAFMVLMKPSTYLQLKNKYNLNFQDYVFANNVKKIKAKLNNISLELKK